MKHFLSSFPRIIFANFTGRNLLWNTIAIGLTYLIVVSGLDWSYFTHTRISILDSFFFPAIVIGGFVPIILPLVLILVGRMMKKLDVSVVGWALAQAALSGSFVSSSYKAFTGRIQPNIHDITNDISSNFNFGFWNHGIFWGWPSSHTTIAFAMSFALITLFPKRRVIAYAAIAYAFYVGIGVSLSIHWLSDFVAGAIIGTVLGMMVGNNFRTKLQSNESY